MITLNHFHSNTEDIEKIYIDILQTKTFFNDGLSAEKAIYSNTVEEGILKYEEHLYRVLENVQELIAAIQNKDFCIVDVDKYGRPLSK